MRGLVLGAIGLVLATHASAAPATPADVVAAERQFAADGQARGWIAAFKKYAAPDAIAFQPDPVNVQQAFASRPDEPADRSLKWWPIYAGIAQSGELGFTTGPFTVGDRPGGFYFTVWAKQPDGSWRWIYDGGPRHKAASPFGPETEPVHLPLATGSSRSADAAWAEVGQAEAALARAAAQSSSAGYLAHLSSDSWIMGSPEQPATDSAGRVAELGRRAPSIAFSQIGGRASRAGDLVYTYGDAQWASGRGHYVRIWQRRSEGWKLVFDELLVVPLPKPAATP